MLASFQAQYLAISRFLLNEGEPTTEISIYRCWFLQTVSGFALFTLLLVDNSNRASEF